MKTLVILNGECKNSCFLKEFSLNFDKIICADGGYKYALDAGVVPDVVVGDFDSSFKPHGVKTVVYPADKDLSDAEIAIEYAKENFGGQVVMTCSLGKRLDHQIFNLFLLLKYKDLVIEEVDTIAFLCDKEMEFCGFENKTVSFLPIKNSNISLSGFKYPLEYGDVKMGQTLTLSNIALNDAKIIVNFGAVIAIINKTDI